MTGSELHGRRRPRDPCAGGASRPGGVEHALLERMAELRALVDEYDELLRWAQVLGYDVPGDRSP